MSSIIKHYEVTIFGRGGLNGGGGVHNHICLNEPTVESGHLIVEEVTRKFSYNLADVTMWYQCAIFEG